MRIFYKQPERKRPVTYRRTKIRLIAYFLAEKTCKLENKGAISLKNWVRKMLTENSILGKKSFRNEGNLIAIRMAVIKHKTKPENYKCW